MWKTLVEHRQGIDNRCAWKKKTQNLTAIIICKMLRLGMGVLGIVVLSTQY